MIKRTLVLMAAASFLLTGCYETGAGKKVGMITKVATEGMVCKTYEAQIQRGGFNGGSGVNGQAFGFTIENPELAKKVEDLMNRQAEVEITYRSELLSFCRSDNQSHFLVDIKEIGSGQQAPVAQVKPVEMSQSQTQAREAMNRNGDVNAKMIQMLQLQNEMLQELIKERQQK